MKNLETFSVMEKQKEQWRLWQCNVYNAWGPFKRTQKHHKTIKVS